MADNTDLLAKFGNSGGTFVPAETVAIQVTGYVLPPGGLLENTSNARILGTRWDTGETVEVAFRAVSGGRERPSIAQFHRDDSSTPVTTAIGGTIMLDAAYPDDKLTPLRGQGVPVLSARWGTRIAPDNQHGWAIKCLARVNEPRLLNENNPNDGYYQTISLMHEKHIRVVNSLDELDAAVLDALDTQRRDESPDWHERPGALSVHVRLSVKGASAENPGVSKMITLSAKFHTPPQGTFKIPNTRAMIIDDLKHDAQWLAKRATVADVLADGQYVIEVIPSSQLYVGKKTVQAGMQGKASGARINGMSLYSASKEKNIPLFSQLVIGVRPSPKTGQPQALFAAPHLKMQLASLTGIPSQDDIARLSEAVNAHDKKFNKHDNAGALADAAVNEALKPAPVAAAPVTPVASQPLATPAQQPAATPPIAFPSAPVSLATLSEILLTATGSAEHTANCKAFLLKAIAMSGDVKVKDGFDPTTLEDLARISNVAISIDAPANTPAALVAAPAPTPSAVVSAPVAQPAAAQTLVDTNPLDVPEPLAVPAPTPVSPVNATPPSAPIPDDRLQICRASDDGSLLSITANTPVQAACLAGAVKALTPIQYDPATGTLIMKNQDLATLMMTAQRHNLGIYVVPSDAPALTTPSPAPLTQAQAQAPAAQQAAPLVSPAITTAPATPTVAADTERATPAINTEHGDPGFDLAGLDLGDLDIDSTLQTAYAHDEQPNR